MTSKSAVLVDFKKALLCYSTTKPWYYCIDLAEDNPHSLSAALGLTHEHLLRILVHCGLAKKHGRRILISKSVPTWQEILTMGDIYLNYSSSQIFHDGNKKTTKLFIRLGISSIPDNSFPKDQRYEQSPPCLKRKTEIRITKRNLMRFIEETNPPLMAAAVTPSKSPCEEISRPSECITNETPAVHKAIGSISKAIGSNTGAIGINHQPLDLEKRIGMECAMKMVNKVSSEYLEGRIASNHQLIASNDDERQEIDALELDASTMKKIPLLKEFNVPLRPVILTGILSEITKLNQLFPEHKLNQYKGWTRNHVHIVCTFAQSTSRESFRRYSGESIRCK